MSPRRSAWPSASSTAASKSSSPPAPTNSCPERIAADFLLWLFVVFCDKPHGKSRHGNHEIMDSLPTQARVVIVGGGIVGCSVAHHLTKLGWRDVVVIEQGRLSGGTTWHAAGLVGQLRSHANMTRLIRASTELYAGLEAKTGLATGWKQCGSLTVATTPERMTMLRRTASMARAQGVPIELLSPREAAEKWPIMRHDDLVGAAWLPG